MADRIDDATIEYVSILAQLSLTDEEKEQAKADMERMLTYMDKLQELDTAGTEPMSHVFPLENVFREDVVMGQDEVMEQEARDKILQNAPEQSNHMFVVPRTIDGQ